MTMSKSEVRAVARMVNRLEALSNPSDQTCAVDPAAKEAVRLYVQSWILPTMRALAKPSSERDYFDGELLTK